MQQSNFCCRQDTYGSLFKTKYVYDHEAENQKPGRVDGYKSWVEKLLDIETRTSTQQEKKTTAVKFMAGGENEMYPQFQKI